MSSQNKLKIIAVIPCLNEENYIADVVVRSRKHVDEVIVIDDGSTDLTAEIARKTGAEVISHAFSKGAGAATRTGFEAAKKHDADIVVTIDGDGQHNPDEIPAVIEPVTNGNADLVIGSRFDDPGVKIRRYRKFGIDVITFLYNFGSKVKITDSQSGFRAHSRRLLDAVCITDNGFGFSVQVIIQARRKGLNITAAPVSCIYHEDGSTLNPIRHGLGVALAVVKHRMLRS